MTHDGWALKGAQLAFMRLHHEEIEAAYTNDDWTNIDRIKASAEYKKLFGEMPWDEAYDRYEETWWIGQND